MDERPMETMAAQPQSGYRVLARKYRPTSFADLIGQEAMVRTLRNAFAAGRLAHAYMLTGVRGVGKTTTARVLARAFNYSAPGHDEPTLDMPQMGVHCEAILDSRHMDVIEMDAASHTGIDDIRDIIDSAAYRPVAARYKVFIIDEVHMLSRAAFNGLLKTLEEPPDHVKFIFATTEIRKVPITVLSRCQRFDLRRIPGDVLTAHLAGISEKEAVEVEDDALALIARAAEGSVRDALSLLDQAIAHGGGKVDAEALRAMLGVADRGRTLDLFETVMQGDIAGALAIFDELYVTGADPLAVIDDLAEAAHLATRFKLTPDLRSDQALNEDERVRGAAFAETLPVSALSRAWQVLLKGHGEVETAPRPAHAAEMVLVRLAHMATMPTPEEALRKLAEGGDSAGETVIGAGAPAGSPRAFVPSSPRGDMRGHGLAAPRPRETPETVMAAAAPAIRLDRIEDIVALAEAQRDIPLKMKLERFVRPVRFGHLSLEFALESGAPVNIYNELSSRLKEWTGQTWMVSPSREVGEDPLEKRRRDSEDRRLAALKSNPVVAAVMAQFPDAEMTVRELRAATPEGLADPEAETDPDGE
ncbi:MAG: DNA polymerase III subunit gamma/tau [Rhodobiaceae bacterium]|nr:DNA polymerase III subunit gamma/tau [Rhodobiaceae bacterium]MCC0055120.1 DNA polymerase III subunit gamma/tau [Rhodobiaceae bacterium]